MLVNEIVREWWSGSHHERSIRQHLQKLGYRFLGKGIDQQAYLEPDTGHVLKIFGTDTDTCRKNQLSKSQNMFRTFAQYCEQHQSNPYLPRIYGWETFYWDLDWRDKCIYLQIRTERLWPTGNRQLSLLYQAMSENAMRLPWEIFEKRLTSLDLISLGNVPAPSSVRTIYQRLATDPASRDRMQALYETMNDLYVLGRTKGYEWDLHRDNIMKRQDGTPVIVDPWMIL